MPTCLGCFLPIRRGLPARYLPDTLHSVASAAAVNPPGTFVLDDTPYWIAAEAISGIRAAVARAPVDSTVRIASVPAFQLDALHRVHVAVRRAVDHAVDQDDGAERLLELLHLVLDYRDLTPAGLADTLDRVLAVLSLDTPAVRTIAAAYFTGDRGVGRQTAYQEVSAAWQDAGVTP